MTSLIHQLLSVPGRVSVADSFIKIGIGILMEMQMVCLCGRVLYTTASHIQINMLFCLFYRKVPINVEREDRVISKNSNKPELLSLLRRTVRRGSKFR
jgi:hypothetical protein